MSKKLIKIMATSLVIAMSLTACGVNKTETNMFNTKQDKLVKLRVWGAQEDQDLLNYLVEEFKQEYSDEATFEIIVEAQEEMECKNTILNDIHQVADVFTFADDQIMTLAAAGVLEPIAYEEEITANNLAAAVEAATLNGRIYAYPLTADNGYFMYYNKNYFTEEDVQTLDGMLKIAEENNKKIKMDWSAGWYLYSFFGNTGLTLGINEDGMTNYCTWNSVDKDIKGIDVAQAMRKIATSPAFMSTDDETFIKGAQEGKIIAGISGAWSAVALEEAWQDGYAAVKLPTYTVADRQVQMASYAGYKMIGVNAYSEYSEWAEKLAAFLSNEQSQTARFKYRGQGPSNINAANSEEVSNSVAIKALIEQSKYASVQRVGELYWDAASNLGQALASGDLQGLTYQGLLDQTVRRITASLLTE